MLVLSLLSSAHATDRARFTADGTTNFIHGFPYACISLGLISFKRPVLGVIYNPFLNQLYSAIRGGGAFLEQASLPAIRLPLADPPRPLPSLSQALIGIEWGSDRSLEMVEKKGESFKRLAGDPSTGVVKGQMAHSLRSLGSAALNYGLVAQGGLDIYWCVCGLRARCWKEADAFTSTGRSEHGTWLQLNGGTSPTYAESHC